MARDLPSPCCGSYDIQIKHNPEASSFACSCSLCGLTFGEPDSSRYAALYNFETAVFQAWKKYPNGMRDWMKSKPKSPDDLRHRLKIERDVKAAFGQQSTIRRF